MRNKRLLFFAVYLFLHLQVNAQCWPRLGKVEPQPDKNPLEDFGHVIDQEGDIAVVGAPYSDSLGFRSGLVYVFEKAGAEWIRVASLYPSDYSRDRYFGQALAISGNTIVVGDLNYPHGVIIDGLYEVMGALYIFEKPAEGWTTMTETHRIFSDDPLNVRFGNDVDIHQNSIIVGGNVTLDANKKTVGAAYIFERSGSTWIKVAKLSGRKQSYFGEAVAIHNNLCVVSTYLEYDEQINGWMFGTSYVFEKPASGWTDMLPTAQLTRSEYTTNASRFGEGIALDDNTIFLTDPWLYTGGSNGPALYVYNRPPGGWADTTEDAWYYDTNPGTSLLQSQVSLDGDYVYFSGYESVRVFKKDNPASWTSLTPHASIKPDDIENSARFGFDLTAKNGRVLISAPGSSTFSSNSFIRIQNPKVFEFNLPPSGWDNPTSDYTSIIEYMPVTGAGSYFGIAVDVEGDYAVVGSSRDQDNGVYSGSAYVLKFDGLNWQRIAELTPSDGQPYDNFGLDVSISGDFIAVNSVYSDRYDENGNRISYTTGAVYVFRKPVGGWTDMNESYKVTLDDLNLKSFGRSVAIDMPYLVVGQYEDRSSEDLGTVHVFKFTGDGWIKQATLLPKVPGPGDGFGCEVAIEDSVIVVGARSSRFWFQESNRVFIYQQPESGWKDTTESAILYPSDVGIDGYLVGRMFGYAVDIQGDEIIVGCPGWIGNEPALGNPTNLFRGAAYIYKKPESGWVGLIKEQAILKPEIEIPYHNFGYSVKIEERYAVAGAPQNIIYTYGGQNPGPGKVYFFQKPESGWISKSPDKIIIGDESDPSMTDYFGSAVTSTFGYLFVGAFADDNSTGADAGSVYVYTEYPFIEQARSPMCEKDEPVTLKAYPGGGTWFGNGIADADAGLFDPSLVPGKSSFISYKVDDCDASNRIVIRVIEHVKPFQLQDADSTFFCGKDSVVLAGILGRSYQYQWEFSSTPGNFSPAQGLNTKPVYTAEEQGYYQLIISNFCSAEKDTIWVGNPVINAGQDIGTCLSDPSLTLTAKPSGGLWSGSGITDPALGTFNQAQAGLGQHQVRYVFSPELNCQYADTLLITVGGVPEVKITSSDSAQFCYTGLANLQASPYPGAVYAWYYRSDDQSSFNLLEEPSGNLIAEELGAYQVLITNQGCDQLSPLFTLNPDFQPEILPSQRPVSFCWNSDTQLQAEEIPGASYLWLFSPDLQSGFSSASGPSTFYNYKPTQSGFYQVEINSHGCYFLSGPIEGIKTESDSVFVANVITPNGDRFNQELIIQTREVDAYQFNIFNRYGDAVYSADQSSKPWTGSGSHGVYYWIMTYPSKCQNGAIKTLRGTVTVLGETD